MAKIDIQKDILPKEQQISEDIKKDIRTKILIVENEISKLPGAMFNDCFPLIHTFADGMYIREIRVPKGNLVVTKIHKLTHPFFLLQGECSILTEEGVKRIKAPYSGITQVGTKRIIYIHEDVIWTTVHATEKTDLKEIEEDIIAKDFKEIGIEIDDKLLLDFVKEATKEETKCLG